VYPADGLGTGLAQPVAAVDQQPQRHGGVVRGDLPQSLGPQRNHGDAVRVDGVGFAALAGGANTRARADSFAGTSTTVSPSAARRWAMCRPVPLQPSTAQTRWPNRRRRGRHGLEQGTEIDRRAGSPCTVPKPRCVA
jgi:hypothetical protein